MVWKNGENKDINIYKQGHTKKLDSEIDGINIVSRSEAVEKIIEKHVSEKRNVSYSQEGRQKT